MKKLDSYQMENIIGGECLSREQRNAGCAMMGIAAGMASGFNPFIGGLTTAACMLLTPTTC